MNYPARMGLDLPSLDLCSVGTLTFHKPDSERFPCLRLGYEALSVGGTMPAALNAANEVAVAAYLQEQIRFQDIAEIIRRTMDAHQVRPLASIEDALETDRQSRDKASTLVRAVAPSGVH